MKILVIGAGGVGWPLATGLAYSLPMGTELVVADDDTMEGSGARRLPQGRRTTFGQVSAFDGLAKVAALRQFIAYVGCQVALFTWNQRIEPSDKSVLEAFDLVIDCTDAAPDWRNQLKAACREGAYLRVSYDIAGGNIFAIVSPSVPFSLDTTTGGYQQPPTFNHAMFAGAWAAEVILRRLSGWNIELPIRVQIPYTVQTVDTAQADEMVAIGYRIKQLVPKAEADRMEAELAVQLADK